MNFQRYSLYIVVNDRDETLMYIGHDEVQYPLFTFTSHFPPHIYDDLASAETDALSYGGKVKQVTIVIKEDD